MKVNLWFVLLQFKEAAKSFGDISDDSKPDDFFGIMDTFINSINDAKQENERIRQLKEEEERRAKLEEQVKLIEESRFLGYLQNIQ